ncbi:acyl-CoA dehydrogenase NM domain-like protein [Cryphonectria parasitica EP155]|uniref:Acyl-CoA dehydrogenase NM domain-like protein n=1 Tax=Cryphonectria parasitica (strain ATCC 38755 / EP155) TaxID=660469 RepID=A0A9P5CNP4_CRYP1|nr:acyl-CoA dehydrogenase NM domain-like protein [Cryphonectria parasitica EP155]KAF3765363.1 acyl-CoA dehydrogenase NM domain-like protein [Cryphonectria parasitica EP155]
MSILSNETRQKWLYGSTLPYAEAPWARGCPSPYYRDSHRRLRDAMRTWVETNLVPFVQDWEQAATLPAELWHKAAEDGVLMPMGAGSKIPEDWRGVHPIIGNVPPEEWDGFHDFILHDEFGRVGGAGFVPRLFWIYERKHTLAIPAIQRFGSAQLRQRVIPDVLRGKSRIALAITEPDAGSDVAGLQTEARLTADGQHFIINGQKKWISSGTYADYFLTLVKESDGNFTLLVVPRQEGLTTRHITVSGSTTAGTAFVDFDDVKVPVGMVVGERGKGFKYVVSNFNHERLFISMQALRCSRVCLEDSIQYALSRQTFGKVLVEHAVIRYKFANMSREVEALQSWLESLIYQLHSLSPAEAEFLLAGTTAQIKAHAGIVLQHVAGDAIQIMGGIGLTRGGRGERVERIWRDVKALTVPGGSEEIMLDLAVRRAVKAHTELERLSVSKERL